MFESNADDLIIEKLSILYVLKNTTYNISDTNLTQIILGTDVMEYFTMMSLLPEMIELKFITTYKKDDLTIYAITQSGLELLNNFEVRIPKLLKDRIDQYLFKNKDLFSSNVVVYNSKYIRNSNEHYNVNLVVIKGNKEVMNLTIEVKTENEAIRLCSNWKNAIDDKYSTILNILSN